MVRKRKSSRETELVLQALGREPDRARYGYELGDEVGLRSGSLYPILMRLADRGLLEATWDVTQPGRPPRHLYRLTGAGLKASRGVAASRPADNARLSPARSKA